MGHKIDPAKWERLVSEERRALLDPEGFLDRLAVRPGDRVADLGAGPGFFTLPLAERVGPAGRVYALDVSAEMLDRLRARNPPEQVEIVQSEESRLPLATGAVGLALLAFVLHELHDPPAFLAEVRRILAPGGRLVVLEWTPREEEMGPPLAERLPRGESRRRLEAAGFEIAEEGEPNTSNYFLVARPAAGPSSAAWERVAVPDGEYAAITRALASAESPVGIDAKHTHVLILHALDRIERRLAELERRLGGE